MTDRPDPEKLQAAGLLLFEFGRLQRTINDALAEALPIVRAIDPSQKIPRKFEDRKRKLLFYHRIRLPMKACRSKVEPLLLEFGTLVELRNAIAHGQMAEHPVGEIEAAAERAAAVRDELEAAMVWRHRPVDEDGDSSEPACYPIP